MGSPPKKRNKDEVAPLTEEEVAEAPSKEEVAPLTETMVESSPRELSA
jgi:hypothetical protein